MQASKRVRLGKGPAIGFLEDPIQNRWFIRYLHMAFECDTPILELFWPMASKMLLLLMEPFAILAKFEAILLPTFRKVSVAPRRYARILHVNSVAMHWTVAFKAHGEEFGEGTARTDPGVTLEFFIGRDEDLHTRRSAIEIDRTGFNVFTYQATFRKKVYTFETLEATLLGFKQLNEQGLAMARDLDGQAEWQYE
jgi:hypothetical protein